MKRILLFFFVILSLFCGIECQAQKSQLKKETIHKNGLAITKYGAWYYWDQKNPITDQVLKFAQNQSENQEKVGYGSTILGLGLSYTGEVTAINFVISSGAFRSDLPQVYVRFDNGAIETFGCMTDGSQSLYILDAERFMKGLKQSKLFVIQVEPSSGGKVSFTFNNSGLEWNYPIIKNN